MYVGLENEFPECVNRWRYESEQTHICKKAGQVHVLM